MQLKSKQGKHLQTFCNLFSGKDHGNNSGSQINLNKLSLHFKDSWKSQSQVPDAMVKNVKTRSKSTEMTKL